MITPIFEIDQDQDFVIVKLRAPHIKVNTFDFYIENKTFKFYGKPYFLRLVFPSSLVEDGREKASYDIDTGIVTVLLPKKNQGENFEDLDLLTLLKKKEETNTKKMPAISVISEMESNSSGQFSVETETEDGQTERVDFSNTEEIELDWDFPQELRSTPDLLNKYPYGFNNKTTDYFDDLEEELGEILELSANPNALSFEERKQIRQIMENNKFDIDHYMADYMDDEMIQEILQYEINWENLDSTTPNPSVSSTPSTITISETSNSLFSDLEKEMLRNLPNKEYLLTKEEERIAMLNLLDILLAFTYDLRTTFGSHTVESSWTVSKVSSVFSFADSFHSLPEVLSAFLRRSLSYPLYSHWKLSVKIIEDVSALFEKGKRYLIKTLLAVKRTMQFSDFHAHFNRLYIDDYCIWIQRAPTSIIQSLSQKLKDTTIERSFVEWDLDLLERTAKELDELSEEEEE